MFTGILSGHLTTDANFKTFGERGVVNFTVAVNFRTGKKDENGNFIDEVEFYQCAKWFGSVEEPAILQHLKKGKKVIVEFSKIQATFSKKEEKEYVNLHATVNNIELC